MGEQPSQEHRAGDHPPEEAAVDDVVADEPLTCHLCQRPAVLEVHTTGHAVYDITACTQPSDSGVWVCRSCHVALHRWMDRNPCEDAAMLAIAEVMKQALNVIQTPRIYRRRRDMRRSPAA